MIDMHDDITTGGAYIVFLFMLMGALYSMWFPDDESPAPKEEKTSPPADSGQADEPATPAPPAAGSSQPPRSSPHSD